MDKVADKIKTRRLPRFEALIPDELARYVDVEYAGLVRYIVRAIPFGGLLAGELFDRQLWPNTVKSVFRLDTIAPNGETEALG